jgi:putative MATE family efflux protein
MSDGTSKEKKMILDDNMWKVMFQLSWPAVLAMVLYGFNTVFDAIFVGRFVGETALAGVSIAYPLSQMTLGIGSLIGVGAGSALSIALGSKDIFIQKRILGNLNSLSVVISIAYGIVAFFLAEPLVRFMGGQGEPLVVGVAYFKITTIACVIWVHGLALNMVIRAEGKMKSAALIMGIGLVINIIANYVFIVVLGFGAVGAAWGTNIAMGVYTILGLLYFTGKQPSFEANPFHFYYDKKIIKSIMSMGMSSLIMSVMMLVQGVVVFNALSNFGNTSEIAFYGATYRVFMLMLTPLFGLMRALQPVVGINYGAKKMQRVIKSVKVFVMSGIMLMLPFWLALMIQPVGVLSTMIPDTVFDGRSIMNFRIYMAMLPILPVLFISMAFFPAIDKGNVSSILGILRQMVLYVPAMLILPRIFGVHWVYLGSTIIDIFVCLIVIGLFKSTFNSLNNLGNEKNIFASLAKVER